MGSEESAIPWWVVIVVIAGALLMALGAVIALTRPAMLVSPGAEINGAARVYAGYFAVRNLALPALLIAMLLFRARGALNTLILLTAFIQLLDAVEDCLEARWSVLPGVVVVGLLFFLVARKLSGQPFWKKMAWIN